MGSRDDMRMPDGLLPPTLLVVGLGMLATLGWGLGDFGGGLTSRSAPVLGVLFTSQAASLVVGIPLWLLTDERAMTTSDLTFSAIAGVLGASGLGLLYRGLSVGRMGVVAPVAATVTAALPVGFGFMTEGLPGNLAIVGIVLAVVGVVLVSFSPGGGDWRASGLGYAVVTGLCFGTFPIATSGISDDLLVRPVVAIRIASIMTVAAIILVSRQPWRVPRRLWPAMLGIGLVDMLATAAYLGALAVGPLAVAAVLTSLYPVVTVILAAIVLRERITPIHAVGIVAVGAAVALIAAA
jgi:drug/metabolite transporter (DMT)-like permease